LYAHASSGFRCPSTVGVAIVFSGGKCGTVLEMKSQN
jgi:hypothetical protein